MPDPGETARIVSICEKYWRETGVPRAAITEMRLELTQHLDDALAEGKHADVVVGASLAEFAESWAAEHRRGRASSFTEIASGKLDERRKDRSAFYAYSIGALSLVAGVIVGTRAAGGGSQVDNEVWRWVWTIFALVMGIGEIFTAGFFLLPFAIGAGTAAILAWLNVSVVAQWLVFFGISTVSLVYLRRFIDRQDERDQPRVGANRWVGAEGIVLEAVDPTSGSGMVRIEGEEWRAAASQPIQASTKVVVTEVRGARLVVVPLEDE